MDGGKHKEKKGWMESMTEEEERRGREREKGTDMLFTVHLRNTAQRTFSLGS